VGARNLSNRNINNEVKIIEATPENWELYKDIRLEGLREDPQAFGSPLEKEGSFTREKWLKRVSNPFSYIAVSNDRSVGTIGAYMTEENEKKVAHIVGVFVSKEGRGKGVGSMLLEAVLRKLKEDKTIDVIDLTVNEDQTAAVGLYGKFGFKISDREVAVLGDGKEHEEYKMVLEL
jgi:ribosomal protein S18 acetylase RimI-like enzyme